ncbi:hypothetical protein [uncultured Nonlabens sp.]|uniref:hypothetical protein n=1 Tax=uncultured Nonlabens sp. TaxID=859306 RepID=UPI002618ED09|nr:hypothetical protein [uncultured Nonlabens sp.]
MSRILYHNLDYGELFIFKNYVIAQINEGVVLNPENNDEMRDIILNYFTDRKWVYISNRTLDYNVNPITYFETSKIDNLIGVCIITTSVIGKKTALFESEFYSKRFMVVSTVLEAIDWASEVLDE